MHRRLNHNCLHALNLAHQARTSDQKPWGDLHFSQGVWRSLLFLLLPRVNLNGLSIDHGSIELRESGLSFFRSGIPNRTSALALALEDFCPFTCPSLITMGFQVLVGG